MNDNIDKIGIDYLVESLFEKRYDLNEVKKQNVQYAESSVEILTPLEVILLGLRNCEIAGRTCYQSEMKEAGTIPFLTRLVKNHHESVLEHCSITVKFVTDRNVTHQLVRHRLNSYSQESQRYVSYHKGHETDSLIVVPPQELYINPIENEKKEQIWSDFDFAAKSSYFIYKRLKASLGKAEAARSVLGGCTKTTIVVTANLRQWRHIFSERCSRQAQADIRALMLALKNGLSRWEWAFSDIEVCDRGVYRPVQVPQIPLLQDIIDGCKDFYGCDFSPKKDA